MCWMICIVTTSPRNLSPHTNLCTNTMHNCKTCVLLFFTIVLLVHVHGIEGTAVSALEIYLETSKVGLCQNGKPVVDLPEHVCSSSLTRCLRVNDTSFHISSYPFKQTPGIIPGCPTCIGGLCPSQSKMVEVSFVMAVHGNEHLALMSLIRFLVTAWEADSVEFIVVDDASPTDLAVLKQAVLDIHAMLGLTSLFIKLDHNVGYGMANHAGVLEAAGKYLAIVNTDMYPTKGWLAALLWTFKHFKNVGIVGPMFVGDQNLVTEAGGYIFGTGQPGNFGRGRLPTDDSVAHARFADYISAACIVLQKWLYMHVGGFNASFGKGYYEDTDLSMKIRALGFRVVYQAAAVVYHQEGNSLSSHKAILMQRNKLLFMSMWGSHIARTHTHTLERASTHQYHTRCMWLDGMTEAGSVWTTAIASNLLSSGYHMTWPVTHQANTTFHAVNVANLRAHGVHAVSSEKAKRCIDYQVVVIVCGGDSCEETPCPDLPFLCLSESDGTMHFTGNCIVLDVDPIRPRYAVVTGHSIHSAHLSVPIFCVPCHAPSLHSQCTFTTQAKEHLLTAMQYVLQNHDLGDRV